MGYTNYRKCISKKLYLSDGNIPMTTGSVLSSLNAFDCS